MTDVSGCYYYEPHIHPRSVPCGRCEVHEAVRGKAYCPHCAKALGRNIVAGRWRGIRSVTSGGLPTLGKR
jgi:hypothetical protein